MTLMAIGPPRYASGFLSRAAPYQRLIAVGTAVAEELPDVAHFGNHVEIKIGDDQFILSRLAWAMILPRGLQK